jgi:hypothetical protein
MKVELKRIEDIHYHNWTTVDKCPLREMIAPIDEFSEEFGNLLVKLKKHDFIAKQQAHFLKKVKRELKEGEFAVFGEFSKNYTLFSQNAVHAQHWACVKVKLHPFVCYHYMEQHFKVVFVSEMFKNDTIAVYDFQSKLVLLLKETFRVAKKTIYFSDGVAAQYTKKKEFC